MKHYLNLPHMNKNFNNMLTSRNLGLEIDYVESNRNYSMIIKIMLSQSYLRSVMERSIYV